MLWSSVQMKVVLNGPHLIGMIIVRIESLFKLSFHNATYTGLKTRCSIFKLLIVYSFALVLLTYSLPFHQYISNVLFIDSIDGVMVSVLASSAVDTRKRPQHSDPGLRPAVYVMVKCSNESRLEWTTSDWNDYC
jgi:hypothetical protein